MKTHGPCSLQSQPCRIPPPSNWRVSRLDGSCVMGRTSKWLQLNVTFCLFAYMSVVSVTLRKEVGDHVDTIRNPLSRAQRSPFPWLSLLSCVSRQPWIWSTYDQHCFTVTHEFSGLTLNSARGDHARFRFIDRKLLAYYADSAKFSYAWSKP
jgi:hypothetical protein